MHNFFDGVGDLRSSYESVDWASTPLGPMEAWDETLRNTVGLMLHTKFPVTLFWGPKFVLVYNEAYVELIGDKHPAALGTPAEEVFPEAWEIIGPMMDSVLDGGPATWVEDEYVPLHRRGFLEECYFTFSYSPVRSRDGHVHGVMDIAGETTEQVISRRRLQLLGRLSHVLGGVDDLDQVPRDALSLLRGAPADFAAVDVRVQGLRDPATGLPDAPAGWASEIDVVVEGDLAWLPLGPVDAAEVEHLVVRLSPRLAPDEDYLGFLRLVAVSLRSALDRVRARAAERHAAEVQRGFSEEFQRSLLPEPTRSGPPEVAVRYQPAQQLAQIGGDWYDLFELPDGSLTVVIGDVAGHDQRSAATMAQIRNITRGVAWSLHPAAPAHVLAGLDRAVQGTTESVFATAVLAQVRPRPEGGFTLTWSNAGHPPPLLIGADGSVRLLERDHDALLGIDTSLPRRTHEEVLEPGATLVLYTDGLVERRGAPLGAGLAWLSSSLTGTQGLSPDRICDYLLEQVRSVEDDVALLVLRA